MEYIKSVTLFLVFIAFLENVLVLGNMKKYARLLCGIILIFIVLQPVGMFVGTKMDIDNMVNIEEIEEEVSKLNEEYSISLPEIEENTTDMEENIIKTDDEESRIIIEKISIGGEGEKSE